MSSAGAFREIGRPKVVTLGGGHGQAAVLSALVELECEITAVVSIADDGGCSGKLRTERGMAPPGDLRRCLTTLARDRRLAERFELRLLEPGAEGRSAGNLALSEAFLELGSLQAAVDWAAELLSCRGRVVPVAEAPGVLAVYDQVAGAVEGETNVEQRSAAPMVAVVHGPEQTNPVAQRAIAEADLLLLGPGSFITSTLATLTTADVAEAVAQAPGRRVLVHNLTPEGEQLRGASLPDYVRLLSDHLVIGSGQAASLEVLEDGSELSERRLDDGTRVLTAPLAASSGTAHDPHQVATALCHWFGLTRRPSLSIPPPSAPSSVSSFEDRVARARAKLGA